MPFAVSISPLHLASNHILACVDAQSASTSHEEQVARVGIGIAVVPHIGWHHAQVLRIPISHYMDVLLHPISPLIWVGTECIYVEILECITKICLIWLNHFVIDARIHHIFEVELRVVAKVDSVIIVVEKHIHAHVAKVFLRDYVEQVESLNLIVGFLNKAFDSGMVATSTHKEVNYLVFWQIPHQSHLLCRCFVVECSFIQAANRVFSHETALVMVDLLLCQRWHSVTFHWWNKIELNGAFEALLLVENHHYGVFTTHTYLLDAERIVFRSPDHKVAKSAGNICIAICITLLMAHCVEFGVVIYLEIYLCRYWLALGIYGANHSLSGRSIIIGNIDFGIAVALAHHVFRTFVVTKHLCVHHHTSRCWSVKPTEV